MNFKELFNEKKAIKTYPNGQIYTLELNGISQTPDIQSWGSKFLEMILKDPYLNSLSKNGLNFDIKINIRED